MVSAFGAFCLQFFHIGDEMSPHHTVHTLNSSVAIHVCDCLPLFLYIWREGLSACLRPHAPPIFAPNRVRYKQIRTTERNSNSISTTGNSLFTCAYGDGKLGIYTSTYIFKFCDEHKMQTQFHIWNCIDDVDAVAVCYCVADVHLYFIKMHSRVDCKV